MADNHRYSVEAAREAAQRDELGTWVAEFLSSPGSDNAELGAQLTEPPRYWLGPVQVPLSHLHRLAGPEGAPVVIAVDDDHWEDYVDDMKDGIEEGWDPPPLIVSYRNGQLVLEDGNHRVESLRRAGEPVGWAVIGFDDPEQRDRFNAPTATASSD
jgi:hypothetical protein